MATRRIGQVDRVVATDGELVMRVRNGDQAALAAIYDRYVARLVDLARAIVGPSGAEDVVHDAFVGAAGRIDQLRDPDKLKPWLYRITRRYALAHLRGRRVEPMGLEVTVGDATVDGPLTEAERDELRRLVDDAAAGLEERDRVMLHLLYRHELSPEEAGEVLDMRAEQVHARSFRVRDRFARSLGAVVVARHGRGRCDDLRELLVGWDGTITPRWRKKISRHLDKCEVCSSTKDRVAAPMALLSVAPLVPIAASMRNQTLDAMSNALGFGSFDAGDADLDGDSSSEQSQQGPQHPSQSSANHPASQGTASSTSSSTASSSATAGSAAPSASASATTSAGLSSGSSSSVAAGTANAGAAGAAPMSSSVSASSLTPTGPTTGWPSGTLAAGGGSSGASSSAAVASSAKATSGAAVPPTPEIVSSAPPPPELSEPGIASSLIDTVKAAVGVGVGGAIAVTSTTVPPVDDIAAEEPPGLVIEVDGETIALSPAEPVEITVPIGAPTTVPAPAPAPPPSTEATTTTTTVPETTTTTTTEVPDTTVPDSTVPTTTETTVPEPTTPTTEPEPEPTTTTVPDTTTTVDPLGGPTGADDGETGGSEADGEGETGGADDGETGGADEGETGGADDGATGGADEGDTTDQP